MPTSALRFVGAVKANVRSIAEEVLAAADAAGHPVHTIYGYDPNSQPEHSAGTALDFMCDRAGGDWIAEYLWTHRERLGLRWEIWRQRIRSTSPGKPGTWQGMSDRGDSTQNHYDHVHANFHVRDYQPPAGRATAGLPWLPVANARNPQDGEAALLVKRVGIRLGVLDPAWDWSHTGERGFEWPRLVRRLQEVCGDTPDPESEDPAVCYLGTLQLRRLAQLSGLFNAN